MQNPFRYFKTSPEVIRLAVMMYVRFPLSLRQGEDLLREGEALEVFVTKRRDRNAALRFLRKAMKRYGRPEIIVADKLRSTTISIRNVTSTIVRSSNSTVPLLLPSGVNLRFDTNRIPVFGNQIDFV